MDKKYRNGLVLGKFMPLTLGHLYLINTAAKNCEYVYVMLCSVKSEPISGELRYKWLLEEVQKLGSHIEVIHCEDKNPSYPVNANSVDEFYNKYWVPSVYTRIPSLDAVFTSEGYGDEFAAYLGVEHFLCDIDRTKYPISGTAARKDMLVNWGMLATSVKRHYMKRVAVVGPESTYKSTLVKDLAKYFGVPYVEEFGRTYHEFKDSKTFDQKDFNFIADQQLEFVNLTVGMTTGKVVFVDTEAITTKVFGEMYLEDFDSSYVDTVIDKQHYDLYLLMDIDVPWIDDGTRNFPDPAQRQWHFNRLMEELNVRNLPFAVINGTDYTKRFENALTEVNYLGYLY